MQGILASRNCLSGKMAKKKGVFLKVEEGLTSKYV
jgi:hypothetical protein